MLYLMHGQTVLQFNAMRDASNFVFLSICGVNILIAQDAIGLIGKLHQRGERTAFDWAGAGIREEQGDGIPTVAPEER